MSYDRDVAVLLATIVAIAIICAVAIRNVCDLPSPPEIEGPLWRPPEPAIEAGTVTLTGADTVLDGPMVSGTRLSLAPMSSAPLATVAQVGTNELLIRVRAGVELRIERMERGS